MSNDDDGPEVHGFALPLPSGIGRLLGEAMHDHDRDHMRAIDMRNRVYEFLDGLDEEQCRVLRYILGGDDPVQTLAYNRGVDGMLITLLRLKFKVDPDKRTEELLPPVTPTDD